MPCAADIHVLVQLPRMKRPYGRPHMPYAVSTLESSIDVIGITKVTLHILDPWIFPRSRRFWQNIKGHNPFGTSLHQHLYQSLTYEAAAAGHSAFGRYGRKALLGRDALKLR